MIHAFRGELDESAACLAVARDRFPDAAHIMPVAHLWTQWLAAELCLAQGEPDAARARVQPILDAPEFRVSGELWRLVLVAARTEVGIPRRTAGSRTEESPSPPERLNGLVRLSETVAADSLVGAALAAQLDALRARLAGTDTTVSWQRAVDAWAATGQAHDRAWALLGLTECHLARRDKDAARTALAEALEIGTRLGARPLVNAVHETAGRGGLPTAGWPGSPATRPKSSYGLTPRELEVLRVVAQGHSNDEIAGELFISPKTVSVHVSNILAKLGVASRSQATSLAYREGLVLGTDHHGERHL